MSGRDDEGTSFDPRTWSADGDGDAPVPPPPPSPKKAKAKKAAPPPPPPPPPSESVQRDSTSFDPRAWGSDEPGADAKADAPADTIEHDTTSFDPRAWQDSDVPLVPGEDAGGKAGGGKLIAVVAALLLAAGGGAGYWFYGRGEAPAPAPTATVAATPASGLAAPPPKQASRRTLMLAGPGDLLVTLTSAGVPGDIAKQAASSALAALGKEPGEVRLVFDLVGMGKDTSMTRLEATRADGAGLILTADAEGGYTAEKLQAKLTTRIEVVRGEMDADSFYSSAVTAGVDDSLIDAFADAFTYDFNFATDLKPGDIFEAAFARKINPSGQAVGQPQLLYVSLVTASKSRALYRFLAPGETEAGWFDANGRSTVRALMRMPISGARITSNFGPRFHPVLHYTRLHGGTDFAAPVGTPIYAAASGVVTSASPSACAGNMVIIKHDNGWETRYFHSSRYAEGIAAGVRVTQGQTVSYVGNTGTCTTGPHLHYEVHIDGEKVDPMSIDTGTGVALEGSGLAAFRTERDRIDSARAAQAN